MQKNKKTKNDLAELWDISIRFRQPLVFINSGHRPVLAWLAQLGLAWICPILGTVENSMVPVKIAQWIICYTRNPWWAPGCTDNIRARRREGEVRWPHGWFCSTGEQAVRARTLSGFFAGQDTFLSQCRMPLSSQVYKWVPADLMLGDNPALN